MSILREVIYFRLYIYRSSSDIEVKYCPRLGKRVSTGLPKRTYLGPKDFFEEKEALIQKMLESYEEFCPLRNCLTAVFYKLKRKFEEEYFARNTKSFKKNIWETMGKIAGYWSQLYGRGKTAFYVSKGKT